MYYNSSTDSTGKSFVIGSTQTITFPQPTTPVTNGTTPVTLTATASSGLAVTYTVTSGPAAVSGSTLTYTGVGTVMVTATQAGNSQYAAATPVSVTIVVQSYSGIYAAQNTAVGSSSTVTVAFTFTATTTLNATLATAIQVLTQGNPSLDFTYAPGGTCAAGTMYSNGNSCTVNVTFQASCSGESIWRRGCCITARLRRRR